MGYPCELTIHSSYLLSPNDELVLIHEASISGSDGLITPINLVNHAYWNLSGDFKQSTIADHDLRLNCDKVVELD
jgi:aldose 1-epimerase